MEFIGIGLIAKLAVVIKEAHRSYMNAAQLPKVVHEFFDYLESIRLLLEKIEEQQFPAGGGGATTAAEKKAADDDNKPIAVAFTALEQALHRGLAVVDECSTAPDPPSDPGQQRRRKPGGVRQLKWRAAMFSSDTEQRLEKAKDDIRDAMEQLTVAGVFGTKNDIKKLSQQVSGLSKDIEAAFEDTTQKLLQKLTILEAAAAGKEQQQDPLKILKGCDTIEDFLSVYESKVYQDVLMRLQASQGEQPPEEWAKEWAIRMRTKGEADEALNRDRKVCLAMLYEICNRWKDPSNTSVTSDSIVQIFQSRRVINILSLALVLDRAQCLYRMKYPGATAFGMHWVSKQHVAEAPSYWDPLLQPVGGQATMNKRLLWLLELSELGLKRIPIIARWLEPQPAAYAESAPPPRPHTESAPKTKVVESGSTRKPDPD